MPPSHRIQNVLIALLAVVAVGVSALAVLSVNRPQAPTALGTTDGPSTAAPGDAAATTSEAPADDAASTSDDGDGPETGVEAWVQAWSDDADLLVVGDGFSNLPTQWVQLWAAAVGDDRPVEIRHWGEAADVSFNDPIELSTGDGPRLTVWSASRDGSTIHDAAERYGRFVEASTAPDAVLVSLGLDSGDEDVAEGLDQLVGEIDEDVPVLVAIAPEGLYDDGVGDAILAWAQEHADRVAVVDLRGATPDEASAEEWAEAFDAALGRS